MVDGVCGTRCATALSARRAAAIWPGALEPSKLSLVDDDTIEREILSSRLALAIMDRASWEFTDLRSRVALLEKRDELDAARRAARPCAGAHRRSTPGAPPA